MSQISSPVGFLQIEGRLDAIGQKYKGQKVVRGAILWLSTLVVITWAGALSAHFIGDASDGRSGWTYVILGTWAVLAVASTIVFFLRPLMMRVRTVQVARMLEDRVPGLHNGLTNGVLLAEAGDLQASPWLPEIFREIEQTLDDGPVSDRVAGAVKMTDLIPIAWRSAAIVLPLLLIAGMFPRPFGHGFHQMFAPAAFVPKEGSLKLVSVEPGDTTLVADQPLEVVATFNGPGTPDATLTLDTGTTATLTATPTDGNLRYLYHIDHVAKTLKYRLTAGGTETPWYTATVVKQIKLQEMTVAFTPPAYTAKQAGSISVKPETIDATPVAVPQGSSVQLSAAIDIPASGAMIQIGDKPPVAMTANSAKNGYSSQFTVVEDTPVAVLITDGAGQIVQKLPEQTFMVHCTRDAAPVIQMKWPTQQATLAPDAAVKIAATLNDDYGLTNSRVLVGIGSDGPMQPMVVTPYAAGTLATELVSTLDIKPEFRKHGSTIRVQVEATDNRDLASVMPVTESQKDGGGPQVSLSPVIEITFRDPEIAANEDKQHADELRQILLKLLMDQRAIHIKTVIWKPGDAVVLKEMGTVQTDLQKRLQSTAETFAFEPDDKPVQKTLLVLAMNPAKDAVDCAATLMSEKNPAAIDKADSQLQADQRRIMETLESLMALLNKAPEIVNGPTTKPNDPLASRADEFKKLDDQLKAFMKEQQRILDQQASLAKKPVDQYDAADKQKLADLLQSEDKLDAFMKTATSDFSKNAEQDMANAAMAKEMQAIYSEVTMAKDALNKQAEEIAVPAEESGLEGAKELSSNLEKWLSNQPDRQQWTQEELLSKSDTPMPELPKELQDMVGELLEQQEDLFDQMEDQNANITDSMDKGVGWDAVDGPIADMSAKGITGNALPNNNEMGGRAGEGRSGRSQGEFVGDTAVGKGGRNTPTRLDPTPFAQGQIKDTSKDPVGGATGGGKMSGEGQAGLTGPVPAKTVEGMKRLATKQAELRNTAERIALQYHLDRYDNFKLNESIKLMRQVESDLNANRYQNAMRQRDVLLDDLDTSQMLASGRVNAQRDTTPTTNLKMQKDLNAAMQGELPPAWSDPLKAYYQKLSAQ
jgi:hypothetical protein